MNIGILTFWNVPNYGTFLQAYALQKTLAELFPDSDVKQIAYLNKKHYKHYYGLFQTNQKLWLVNPKTYVSFFKNLIHYKKVKELKKFLEYYKTIHHTKPLTAKMLKKEPFDCVVLGSDIVWDFSFSVFGSDKFLFGNDFNSKKVISYAASFGTVKNEDVIPNFVNEGISRLDAVAVRDKNSANIVEKITKKQPLIVNDPTQLWNFENDENITKPNIKNYILVYGSFFTEDMIKAAKEYAEKNKLKLVCLNSLDDYYDWCDITINQDEISPFDWVGYFKHSTATMVSTYHGLHFSLIFNKPIVFNATQFMIDKAQSYIEYLGLEDVLIKSKNFDEKISFNWKEKYKEINQKNKELTNLSKKYLIDSITSL